MAVDNEGLLELLGNPGRFQLLLFFILCTNYSVMVFNNVNMALFGARNPHQCQLPANVSKYDAIPHTIAENGAVKFDSCRVYNGFDGSVTNETIACPNGMVHFTEPGEVTVNSEFDLVCDRAYMTGLSTTVYFLGVMIGGVIFGNLSDRYGRRPIMLFCLWSQMALGILLSFVHNFVLFTLVRFSMGVVLQGMQAITVAMTMEFAQIRHRTLAGTSLEVFWAIGILYFSLISYLVRDWHYIQLTLSLHSLITIAYYWILPESIRWLATVKKHDEIVKTVTKLAKLNGVKVNQEEIASHLRDEKDDNGTPQKTYSCLDLLKTPVLRRRTFILCYVWLASMLGYYGLTLSVLKLSSSKYLNMFISGAVELPAYVSSMYILGRFGRRIPFCVFQISGGVICIIAGAIPRTSEDLVIASTVLALVGKFALVGGFSVAFMYTGELYPTVVRAIGVGTSIFFARMGGVLAPQVNYIGTLTYPSLPIFLFGVLITISGSLSLLLPETLHRKLPDTIEEVENPTRSQDEDDDCFDNPRLVRTSEDVSQSTELSKV